MSHFLCFGRNFLCINVRNSIQTIKLYHNEVLKAQSVVPSITPENQYEILADVITPLWKLDYSEQLMRKKKMTRTLIETIKSNKKITKCKTRFHNIIPSPVIESYRNKDEFSIRKGIDGNEKTVGFFIGSPAEGNVTCVQPIKLISLKESHILLSEVFQKLIRESPLRACHDLHDGGYWKNFVVRSNRKGEIMAIVVVNPNGATTNAMEDSIELIKDRLLNSGHNITSLYFQACPHVRCSNDQAPFNLLHGHKYIYETFNDIAIRISPDSFLQVNSEAAELLYRAALDSADVNDKTTIIDLCSGIGIISLIASKEVRGCVAIESTTSSVEDAIFNADYNDIQNCHFFAGRVEQKLKTVVNELELASDVVPIINPARAGVNQKVIQVLRKNINIHKLVYISCNASTPNCLRNFQDLCSLSNHNTAPFMLTDVQPVDMFPQTNHCEHILVFKR